MVEANADAAVVRARRRMQRSISSTVRAGGLFDEHMLAGFDRGDRDRRQGVVGRGDDDHLDVGRRDGVLPALHGSRLGYRANSSARSGTASAQTASVAPPRAAARLRPISPQPTIATRGGRFSDPPM